MRTTRNRSFPYENDEFDIRLAPSTMMVATTTMTRITVLTT